MMHHKRINAEIVADSISPMRDRITTWVLCYPRFIHAELMTHRAFSRNAASSRAIPIMKMIRQVWHNPAIPIRWGKNGKGMQDHGLLTGLRLQAVQLVWVLASKIACGLALLMYWLGLHKQIANRLLEPFAWMETLVTATDYDNFFALRVHKDAQPEFQRLAHLMLKLYVASTPRFVDWGDWHMPFSEFMPEGAPLKDQLKIASARAARLSYLTFDGEMSPEKDFGIYRKLVGGEPGHWSPIEHSATPDPGRNGPYLGWKSFRAHHKNENIRGIDLVEHLRQYEESLRTAA